MVVQGLKSSLRHYSLLMLKSQHLTHPRIYHEMLVSCPFVRLRGMSRKRVGRAGGWYARTSGNVCVLWEAVTLSRHERERRAGNLVNESLKCLGWYIGIIGLLTRDTGFALKIPQTGNDPRCL